jgi:hypothetical protein
LGSYGRRGPRRHGTGEQGVDDGCNVLADVRFARVGTGTSGVRWLYIEVDRDLVRTPGRALDLADKELVLDFEIVRNLTDIRAPSVGE